MGRYYGGATEAGQTLYCYRCGEKLIEVKTGGYDSQTGERLVKYVCPTGKCLHVGHDHKRSKWTLFRKPGPCFKCGDPYVDMSTY